MPRHLIPGRYVIVRHYLEKPAATIRYNLTLEEAQAHCRDPETSSNTCLTRTAREHTHQFGPWFDGYEAIQ